MPGLGRGCPAADVSRGKGGDKARGRVESLIGAAPSDVLRHADRGSECPVDVGGQQLAGRDAPNSLHKIRVARGAEADVVRKDGGSTQVAVAMSRIHAVEKWNAKPALERFGLDPADHLRPRRRIVRCGVASAATEPGTNAELADCSLLKTVDID